MNFTYKQPYVTWKGPSTGSAVPTWSRPLINNNNGANTGTSFAARPIKHWRKQLVPAANSGVGTNAGVGMPMDRPGGSVYLGATVDCSNCPVNLAELIPTTKNIIFDTTKDASGNCVACNPETNIIKSAVTLLNKNYFSDTKGYLQSRGQTYDQKLSINPIPGNNYTSQPSDSSTGSQVYYTDNCSKKCTTNNSRVTTIYKPNNQQYSQQGAVSSSSRLDRLKYNTITKNGKSFKTAWGQQGANAGSYKGTTAAPYFLKSKYQVCVPQHRDGDKTTTCSAPDIVESGDVDRVVSFEISETPSTGINCDDPLYYSAFYFLATEEQINEYTNLNISPTQIWSATFGSGTTFNVTFVLLPDDFDLPVFFIDFLGECIDATLITFPIILTTTIF